MGHNQWLNYSNRGGRGGATFFGINADGERFRRRFIRQMDGQCPRNMYDNENQF